MLLSSWVAAFADQPMTAAIPQLAFPLDFLCKSLSLGGMLERSRKRRRRGHTEIAKLILENARGEIEDQDERNSGKNPAAVALGRLGGKKGGIARAKSLSPKQRSTIARNAAKSRWKGHA
jgi:hypothetical protein